MAVLPTRELSIEFDAGVWTDVFDDVVNVSTRRGRNRELGAYETGTLVATLRNDERQYDPDNADGDHYGKLRPNRRVRFRATHDTITSLRLPGTSGAYASTPDSAALSITGDIDIRVKVALDAWGGRTDFTQLISKFDSPSATQRSYSFRLTTNAGGSAGRLQFIWSPAGSAALSTTSSVRPDTVFSDGQTGWVRATLDADNGAGGHTVTFYTSLDGETWTQLGTTQSGGAGTTSIFDGTNAVYIGADNSGTQKNVLGDVYTAEIRSGINGTAVASPSFDAREGDSLYTGPSTLVDAQGNVWTRQGTATFATTATAYDVFTGYIDRIEQHYGGPNDATAVISVSDRFKILNRVELPRSVYTATVEDTEPDIWYRFDEIAGSTVAKNSGTLGRGYDGEIATSFILGQNGPDFGAESLVVRDGGSAYGSDADHFLQVAIPDFSLGLTGAFAYEAWIRLIGTPDPAGLNYLLFQQGTGLTGTGIGVAILDDLRPRFVIYNDAGTPFAVRTASALTLGEKYHLVARLDDDGTMHVLLDGIDVTVADLGVGGTASGTVTKGSGPVYAPQWIGGIELILDEVAIYQELAGEALTTAGAVLHNSAGRTPWTGDSPGLRLSRVLSLAGVAIADYALDTGGPTLQATSLGGTALSYAQKVEQTELGALFVAKDGDIWFLARDTLITGDYLDPLVDLVDHTGGGLPYRASSSDVDEGDLITRATVSREGSVAITYYDQAAIDEFQAIDAGYEGLLHDDDAYSASYAQWIVNTHKDPRSRLGTVELDLPHTPATMYPGILALELADRVTYVRHPQNVGDPIEEPMRVDAISHETGGHYWRTSLQLSPFNLGEGGYPVWVWGETAWGEHVWGMG